MKSNPGTSPGTTDRPATMTAIEEALDALRQGWQPIPTRLRSRGPQSYGWPNLIITEATFPHHFNGVSQNVAVLTGQPSGGLVDVDLDTPLAIALADAFLPKTGRVFGRAGNPRSHREYVCDPLVKTAKFEDPTKIKDDPERMIVELRSTGLATTWPGSIHHSGEAVEWDARGEPTSIDGHVLHRAVTTLAAAVLLVEQYPAAGGRDNLKLPLVGGLIRFGWTDEEIERFILTVAEAANDEQATDRINGIARTRARFEAGKNISGWKSLKDHVKAEVVDQLVKWLKPPVNAPGEARRMRTNDFYAYFDEHKYILISNKRLWPRVSVNAAIDPILIDYDDNGEPIFQAASDFLDRYREVHQMTWAPGEPEVIEGMILDGAGWREHPGRRIFNLYTPPTITLGDASQAGPWIAHVRTVFPNDADHLIRWFAQRVQRPQDKINHALVLGGEQGIGKDTILVPVRMAVGPWNVEEFSPVTAFERFNPHVKAVILRVSEARDLGEITRYKFYDHMKAYTASPPEMLACDEKFIKQYHVPNVVGVIYTTNYEDGLYLPATDRRHYVAWSGLKKGDLSPAYFDDLYRWFDQEGGNEHVAAYLTYLDLSGFNPKAAPVQTDAFLKMAGAHRSAQWSKVADLLDGLGPTDEDGTPVPDGDGEPTWPEVVTIAMLVQEAELRVKHVNPFNIDDDDFLQSELSRWLTDNRNAKQVNHLIGELGYGSVQNPDTKTGLWKIQGKRMAIYAKKTSAAPLVAVKAYVEAAREKAR